MNILEKYGIKEVADVVMYELKNDGSFGAPVLYFDSLKVSTIEQTAEEVEARGGKGNPPLIIWDFGREITVNLEDALFSMKSLQYLWGGEKVVTDEDELGNVYVWKTIYFTKEEYDAAGGVPMLWTSHTGVTYDLSGADYTLYDADGEVFDEDDMAEAENEDTFSANLRVPVKGEKIEISHNQFPGYYGFVGDTYARSANTGIDEFFQFIIPKAKIQSEQTLELSADGDPSTFNMNLRVMRSRDGAMLKLVKYAL